MWRWYVYSHLMRFLMLCAQCVVAFWKPYTSEPKQSRVLRHLCCGEGPQRAMVTHHGSLPHRDRGRVEHFRCLLHNLLLLPQPNQSSAWLPACTSVGPSFELPSHKPGLGEPQRYDRSWTSLCEGLFTGGCSVLCPSLLLVCTWVLS